jgi:aminoglycoside phosphotransferase (APT) family kinase protein
MGTCLARYLGESLGVTDVRATISGQFTLGGSRSTYPLDAVWRNGDGAFEERPLVLRLDPVGEDGSLVPSSVVQEYRWYTAVSRLGRVPVPAPVLMEASGDVLGVPFIVMERLGGTTEPDTIHSSRFAETRQQIGRQAFSVLGDLASIDLDKLDVPESERPQTVDEAWSRQLEFWEHIHDNYCLQPLPMTRSAIRALRSNPPPPTPRITAVHGDYRYGNFLYEPGQVLGVLDWEMAHVGDPHEDLAWAIMENWRWHNLSLVWGFVEDRDAAFRAWEQASGLRVNHESLAWWRLFSEVKATALWVRAAHAAATLKSDRVNYLLINWRNTQQEEARMAADIKAVWR